MNEKMFPKNLYAKIVLKNPRDPTANCQFEIKFWTKCSGNGDNDGGRSVIASACSCVISSLDL